MKHLGILLACVLLFVVVAPAANPDMLKVNIPETFYIGTTVMPAGDYVFHCNVNSSMVTISKTNGPGISVGVHEIKIAENVKSTYLVFLRDNDRLVLHRFAIQGDDHIHDLVHNNQVAELK
jgi:hypothetical protein